MRGRLLLACVALLVLTGCQAEAEIAIEVDETGAGQVAVQVELDDAAATRIGDLEGLVAAEDLVAAGWRVSVTERRVLAERDVSSAADIERALEELGSPFSGLSLERRETFARTTVEVAGSVDLSRGVAAFGDEELKRVTGSITGVDLPPEALSLSLAIDLPGEARRWDLPLGRVTPVEATSTDVNIVGLLAVGVAVLAALALIFAWLRRVRP